MSLATDQNSYSFSNGGFKLLVQLVNADSVAEVENALFIWLAPECDSDVKLNKYVIVGWTCSHRETIYHILLCHQELNFGPRQTPN